MEEQMEEKIENNYQISFYDKNTDRFVEAYFFYADDDYEADKIYNEKYSEQYLKDKYTYEIEYTGSLRSDRGYEMELERSLY
jgi:hypothetical protein